MKTGQFRVYVAGTYRTKQDIESFRKVCSMLKRHEYVLWTAVSHLGPRVDQTLDNPIRVVETEKAELANSNVVVAVLRRPTPGTLMEIVEAHHVGVPVIAYVIGFKNFFTNSPWLRYHVTEVTTSQIELLETLARLRSNLKPHTEPTMNPTGNAIIP